MFGGAFDPPHWAHRALAETALGQLNLDALHILPTGHAWHKSRVLSPATDRVAMCELAFGDLPKVRLDEREIHREGPSYTADTLRELQREYPQAQLFLVLGADQLLAFKNWVRWQEVLELATLAVANRATNIGAEVPLDSAAETDLSSVDLPFELLNMPLKNISATAVRARVGQAAQRGAALDVLVPEPVARYISQHLLYQSPT
ncbi:nicotinate (nicotinamide) nucleotide adenylyltransferase [Hydrogenophaga sp. BPS33]|uniref:nicotinate (nicotinamide) nucleotide adenylyltransferase n=1 Tax=Hydrogenophaga sp. BPS33 TaxID=2651974 RepID=UPI00131FAF32|nr:nicotinate (nicotinamide) nucleotide adenylyltransferase [Hydrogenophaga sp. BPS33]QHE85993.1 nicotinate (nicotinamide) nucleotide adenylyltransferase [Hydrogenophaga sp. BPS33]